MKQDVPLIFCMLHFDNHLTKTSTERNRTIGVQLYSLALTELKLQLFTKHQMKGKRAQRKTNV